jgi:cytochrome c
MSHNLETNKILASILVAGIVAMLAGFVAKQVVHPAVLEKTVLDIDTSALEAAQSGGAAAPAGPEPILALLAKADAKRGESLAKACLACHDFSKGGPNKIGPNLYGIVNNKKAHMPDFAYSDAIKDMSAKGEHWDYKSLGAFLFKPQAYAKGTKMTFPGFKKAQDRADVIAYLRTLADAPAPLPSATDIAADAGPAAPAAAPAKAAAPAVATKPGTPAPAPAPAAAPKK